MTPPRASDNAPSLLVVASEYLREQAPSTPRIVYSVSIGVAGAKAIAHRSASPRMPGVPSRMEAVAQTPAVVGDDNGVETGCRWTHNNPPMPRRRPCPDRLRWRDQQRRSDSAGLCNSHHGI